MVDRKNDNHSGSHCVKGEWKINCDGYYPYCSNCHHEPKNGVMSNFCPNCGADMRGIK